MDQPIEWTPELREAWSAYRKAKDAFSAAHDGFEAGLLREEQAAWERFQTAITEARKQQGAGVTSGCSCPGGDSCGGFGPCGTMEEVS